MKRIPSWAKDPHWIEKLEITVRDAEVLRISSQCSENGGPKKEKKKKKEIAEIFSGVSLRVCWQLDGTWEGGDFQE